MRDSADPHAGGDFGKYRLQRRIATGGMAEIFLAHRISDPSRPLVIKRILPHLGSSPDFISMFLDEARIAARLVHPNIVAIEDIGQHEGAYYLVMEYVHGEDIRRIYNRAYKLQRSLPLSHSIRVIAEAARGLGFAHKLSDDLTGRAVGVVHRDVSPQNILVTYEGDAKIVDFGIAKAANKVAQTRAGVLKGKYSYMSPEQALGDPIDHRTDIFALGIILYETTTGTRLFKRSSELATLQAIIKCEFVAPSEALPGYPPELEAILLRALARDPEDRWPDAEELSAALYEFLHESGLYVGRDELGAFMVDLFAGEEAEDEAPAGDGPGTRPTEDDVRRSSRARAVTAAPPREPPREPPPEAAPEPEPPGEDADASSVERRRMTERVRPRAAPERPASEASDDSAPTVAAQPSFRPAAPEPRKVAEVLASDSTEQLARPRERRRDPAGDSREDDRARPPAALPAPAPEPPAPLAAWVLPAMVGAAMVLAVLTGIVVSERFAGPGTPDREAAGAGARLVVSTEPGAEVLIDGVTVGTAGPGGESPPIPVQAGDREVTVRLAASGFERRRALRAENGQGYHLEIRARTGSLRVAVAPWARVRVGDQDLGLTPLPAIALPEGTHRVELVNEELGRRQVREVRIEGGVETELKVDLRANGPGPAEADAP